MGGRVSRHGRKVPDTCWSWLGARVRGHPALGCWQSARGGVWPTVRAGGWGRHPQPAGEAGWAELARSGRRFRESGGLGGGRRGRGHAPQLAGLGLLRAAGVVQRTCTSRAGPVVSGKWRGERGGRQRMSGLGLPRWCCRDLGRSRCPGRAGAPVGGGPRVSTQPCRGRGEGGVQMPGHRQRGGGSQKSGWGRLGRLGEPPGSCPAGRRHLLGLCSWGCLWGMPAPSCSAVEGPAPQ